MFPILVAVVAAFILSSAWYAVLGGVLNNDSPTGPWMIPIELLRSTVPAIVVALACDRLQLDSVGALVVAALVAWVGFPVVLLSGSVLHEQVSWRVAAVHAGDWLLKLVAVTLIVGLWG